MIPKNDSIDSDDEGAEDVKYRSILAITQVDRTVCALPWAPPCNKLYGNMHAFRHNAVKHCGEILEAVESRTCVPPAHYVCTSTEENLPASENPNTIIFIFVKTKARKVLDGFSIKNPDFRHCSVWTNRPWVLAYRDPSMHQTGSEFWKHKFLLQLNGALANLLQC